MQIFDFPIVVNKGEEDKKFIEVLIVDFSESRKMRK